MDKDQEKEVQEQIRQYMKNPGRGMVIDGVIASEAIDTSGEILKVDGCDISTLPTEGVLNTEHRGDDAAGYNFNDIIGRCVFAKKIFKGSDCQNDREKMYWEQLKLPFIYGKFRLFDGAGHPSAIAAAAAIRDMLHAGEEVLIRFSIEGSTLQRKGNVLERSVARRVAATWKPANKSANSGVLEDPNGPPLPGVSDTKKKEHEHPGFTRLGGAYEFKGSPIFEEEDLDKGMRSTALGAAAAAIMASSPHPAPSPPLAHVAHVPASTPTPPPIKPTPHWTPDGLDQDLHPIAHIESSFGKNVNHEPNSKGLFHTAVGALGLKPVTAFEELQHNRALRQQYPELAGATPEQFVQTLKEKPRLYNTLATALWQRLKRAMGGESERAAFAWRWGRHAAMSADVNKIKADPYVQKYIALQKPAGSAGPVASAVMHKMEAGNPNAAPSTLTQGAALAREEFAHPERAKRILNGARAALRDWDRNEDFRKFLKSRLPEADPAFIDHFAGMVEDYKLRKDEAREAGEAPAERTRKPMTQKQKMARKQKRLGPMMPKEFEPRDQPPNKPGVEFPAAPPPLPAPGVAARRGPTSRVHMDANAVLHTSQGDYQQSFPTEEHQGAHSAAVYRAILNPYNDAHKHLLGGAEDNIWDTVHAPWHRAMDNWMQVNKMLREGKLPASVIHHAVAFSAMSPNTPVPLQELYYGYLMDISKKFNLDLSKPMSRAMLARLRQGISSNMSLPNWEHDHYQDQKMAMQRAADQNAGEKGEERQHSDKGEVITGADGKRLTHMDKPHPSLLSEGQRWPGHAISDMRENDPPQIQGLSAHHTWLPHLMELVRHNGANGRETAAMLMQMRQGYEQGKSNYPMPFGFGPKLTRYTLGMLGAGNILVPDRHMIRSTFNLTLPQGKSPRASDWNPNDRDQIAHLTRVLSNENNHHVLEAMDHHFFTKHPAVQHVLNKYPEHFKGHEEQAIFPAFWLHWLTIAHHERLRGMPHVGFNGGTDHYPFWASIKHVLGKHNIAHEDSSFDFGANLGKHEASDEHELLPVRTARAMHEIHSKHGELAATWAFHAYMLPALLSAEHADHHWAAAAAMPQPEQVVRKFEAMTIDLRKAVFDMKGWSVSSAKPASPPPTRIKLEGREMEPGEARMGGEHYHVVHQDKEHLYVVPANKGPEYKMQHIQKWPLEYEGKHFNVTRPVRKPPLPKIDSTHHAIPEYTISPAQHALVHGMELKYDATAVPQDYNPGVTADGHANWMRGGNGQPCYVKHDDGMDTPRREVLYHNLAHQFFGLGEYVPTTALVKDPRSGNLASVQEGLPGARHIDTTYEEDAPLHEDGAYHRLTSEEQAADVVKLGRSGELDKLGLMNTILGNHDRHSNNWMHVPGKGIRMIDHGHTLGREGMWSTPSYLHAYHRAESPEAYKTHDPFLRPLHPAAVAWAKTLDPAKLREMFDRHHAPSDYSHKPLKRLEALREALERAPKSTFGSLLSLIR